MRRPVVRALMVVVGLAVLLWHLLLAAVGLTIIGLVFRSTADVVTTVALLLVLTLVLSLISYRAAPAQLLASIDARPISRERSPWIYQQAERAAARMDVEVPEIRIAHMGQPNAFALGGPGWGVVVIDASLVRLLGPDELTAILVHELAHLESYDGLVKTLGFSVLRSFVGLVLLALFPFTMLVRGIARAQAWIRGRPAQWPQSLLGKLDTWVERTVGAVFLVLTLPLLALSRQREFAADARAAEVTGNPDAMARALYRIERATSGPWGILSTLYVQGDEEGPLTRMLSTHPPTEDRIDRLREIAEREYGEARRIEIQ